MGKNNPWVPVTRIGKGMGKNSYPCMGIDKLTGKIFSREQGYGQHIPSEKLPIAIFRHTPSAGCCTEPLVGWGGLRPHHVATTTRSGTRSDYPHLWSSIFILYTLWSSKFSHLYSFLSHSSILYIIIYPMWPHLSLYLNISMWDLVLKDLLKWIQ
jgi:hypothetical protein